MVHPNLSTNDMAAGLIIIIVILASIVHTIVFFWNHIYWMDGQNFVLYERLWPFKLFRKTLALPGFGRTFTIPLISRIKTDPHGKLVQFSQNEIKELIHFTTIFNNNDAIVDFYFDLHYKITQINKFITANELDTRYDNSKFLSEFKKKLKKQFEKQKLLTLRTECFQQWANKVKDDFDFSKYGIVCSKITMEKDPCYRMPIRLDAKHISEIKKLLEMK